MWRNNKTILEIPAGEDTGELYLTELLEIPLPGFGKKYFRPSCHFFPQQASDSWKSQPPVFNSLILHVLCSIISSLPSRLCSLPFLGRNCCALAGSKPLFLAAAPLILLARPSLHQGPSRWRQKQWLSVPHRGQGRRESCLPELSSPSFIIWPQEEFSPCFLGNSW